MDKGMLKKEFEYPSRFDNWRNYVPPKIIDIWPTLSHREKLLVALTSDVSAKNIKSIDWLLKT
jgi:hypothetical protein